MTITHEARWVLDSAQKGISSLHYEESTGVIDPPLGAEDVLVEIHAVSLNYRDIAIAKGTSNAITLPIPPGGIIPASDGAGTVLSIGSAVAASAPEFKTGTKVITHMVPYLADAQMPGFADIAAGLGQGINGTLCRRGVFHYSSLVPFAGKLTFEEAATLTCSGLTAWNAVMGFPGREVKKGDWVLVQGTGGVSLAALQIAVSAGANVIATTSSDAKMERLLALGASHALNYKTEPNWGVEAKKLTPDARGVDHVVDVGGTGTLPQSLEAVREQGLITVAGGVAGYGEGGPAAMSALFRLCVFRGVLLGSRDMLRDAVTWFEEKGIKPALDDVVFELEDAVKGFERLERQEHFSKVVVKIR
ncbi:NAD(P)-binding Rossmann-fold containing protein [Glarea lozoyensis ATCC 20868]|uniref:NAD(P)-binding Rossmann-fold containing protein n=1 Tax=Glarea lozoyensis (strain ATCC 20868 / MF5171) TaxID=1116229 RepID=S3CHL6_GLAL2|nr:NAD(P)-binding Rossmann-fold containing protein [Glarea lozoyensis ATCC 20868]EPE25330.1 NAD(P)-binding Rossmann-fold containing protein [Glarea lozoyensis ATCC 20868]